MRMCLLSLTTRRLFPPPNFHTNGQLSFAQPRPVNAPTLHWPLGSVQTMQSVPQVKQEQQDDEGPSGPPQPLFAASRPTAQPKKRQKSKDQMPKARAGSRTGATRRQYVNVFCSTTTN